MGAGGAGWVGKVGWAAPFLRRSEHPEANPPLCTWTQIHRPPPRGPKAIPTRILPPPPHLKGLPKAGTPVLCLHKDHKDPPPRSTPPLCSVSPPVPYVPWTTALHQCHTGQQQKSPVDKRPTGKGKDRVQEDSGVGKAWVLVCLGCRKRLGARGPTGPGAGMNRYLKQVYNKCSSLLKRFFMSLVFNRICTSESFISWMS